MIVSAALNRLLLISIKIGGWCRSFVYWGFFLSFWLNGFKMPDKLIQVILSLSGSISMLSSRLVSDLDGSAAMFWLD